MEYVAAPWAGEIGNRRSGVSSCKRFALHKSKNDRGKSQPGPSPALHQSAPQTSKIITSWMYTYQVLPRLMSGSGPTVAFPAGARKLPLTPKPVILPGFAAAGVPKGPDCDSMQSFITTV